MACWSSRMIPASGAGAPGSIPGQARVSFTRDHHH